MAKQVITKMLDDLDGGEADETVHFSLDGVGYSVDLSSKNASELRSFLTRYIEAGERQGRVEVGRHAQLLRSSSHRVTVQNTANREMNQKIRAWADSHGWQLADRGRIPQHIVDAFETRTPNPNWVAEQEAAEKAAAVESATVSTAARSRRKAAKAAPAAEFSK